MRNGLTKAGVLLVGGVFLLLGGLKLFLPAERMRGTVIGAVDDWLPGGLWAVSLVEVLVGLGLVFSVVDRRWRFTQAIAYGMLIFFSAFLMVLGFQGVGGDCGCTGGVDWLRWLEGPWASLVRNAVLLGCLIPAVHLASPVADRSV